MNAALENLAWLLPIAEADRMTSFSNGESLLRDALEAGYSQSVRHTDCHTWADVADLLANNARTVPVDMLLVDVDHTVSPHDLEAARTLRKFVAEQGLIVVRTKKSPRGGLKRTSSLVAETLLAAGFREPHVYYFAPSLATPREIVPQDVKAILAWDLQFERTALRQSVRNALILLGRHDWLFEDAIVAAIA